MRWGWGGPVSLWAPFCLCGCVPYTLIVLLLAHPSRHPTPGSELLDGEGSEAAVEQVRWQHQDVASILARKESESQALAGRRDRVSAVLCAATV